MGYFLLSLGYFGVAPTSFSSLDSRFTVEEKLKPSAVVFEHKARVKLEKEAPGPLRFWGWVCSILGSGCIEALDIGTETKL